jgi:hypothetical protein
MIEVTTMFHVKMGSRNIVIPGVRIVRTVVTIFTAAPTVAAEVTVTPMIHRSLPAPGEYVASASGA